MSEQPKEQKPFSTLEFSKEAVRRGLARAVDIPKRKDSTGKQRVSINWTAYLMRCIGTVAASTAAALGADASAKVIASQALIAFAGVTLAFFTDGRAPRKEDESSK